MEQVRDAEQRLARLRQERPRLVEEWFDPDVYGSFYMGEP